MSRTIRRTNSHWRRTYVPTSIDKVDTWDLEHAGLSSATAYINQRAAWFHRDHHSGIFGVPRHYRNRFNRIERHDARAQIVRHLQIDCWDGHLPPRQVKSVGLWWF